MQSVASTSSGKGFAYSATRRSRKAAVAGLGRAAGLPAKLAILVAVGNAVCGNSAIAAVAPVSRAKKGEVASASALTALLGVGVVLALPLLIPLAGLSHAQYGILAGLTVYAVPQVLAATSPVSALSGQLGTLRCSRRPGRRSGWPRKTWRRRSWPHGKGADRTTFPAAHVGPAGFLSILMARYLRLREYRRESAYGW